MQEPSLGNRRSAKGFLVLHLTLGLLVIITGSWAFDEIIRAFGIADRIVAVDGWITTWFQHNATDGATHLDRMVKPFGSGHFLALASFTLLLVLLWKRARHRALTLVLTMGCGALLNIFLKHLFHGQRPVLENPLVTLSSNGFPSAHTMQSALFYGFVALLASQHLKQRSGRAASFLAATLIILLIGLSRIYIGAHYLSDVLGALTLGVAWLALCWTEVDGFRKRRASSKHV